MKLRKRGRGRPALPKKHYRGEIFSVRLNPEEAAKVKRAIQQSGQKPSEWIRHALLETVERASGPKRGTAP
jgi:hypothetical protein